MPALLFGALMNVLLFGVLYRFQVVKGRAALRRWAAENGYKLVSFRRIIFSEFSEFPFRSSKAQQAFRVVVDFQDGRRKSGAVLLGSIWTGLASDAAKVKWED